ncbi:MAG: hypothetical protein ACM3RX_07620 [Methanococcaceae archaeon]
MEFRAILTVIHILSAVVWLGFLPADLILRKSIRISRGKSGERKLISVYMGLTNLSGMIGMAGVLITGLILTATIPYYSFFSFSSNHWLTTKQIIMVLLIVLTFAFLIPSAKKVRQAIGLDLESTTYPGENTYTNLRKLETIITISNVLVLLNFLLAITHRYFGA